MSPRPRPRTTGERAPPQTESIRSFLSKASRKCRTVRRRRSWRPLSRPLGSGSVLVLGHCQKIERPFVCRDGRPPFITAAFHLQSPPIWRDDVRPLIADVGVLFLAFFLSQATLVSIVEGRTAAMALSTKLLLEVPLATDQNDEFSNTITIESHAVCNQVIGCPHRMWAVRV